MEKYFAASNSAKGFCSYYNECFGDADKLYIIKGGPGTGKSSFMKKCAQSAEGKGYFVEYFYCSSDPDSLDGIIIYKGEKSIVVLDGTAPHVYDMVYPGIRDNIINLGDAWREEILDASREDIFRLCREKTNMYKRAYEAHGSCGNLYAVIDSYYDRFLKRNKMELAAGKLVDKYNISGDGRVDIRLIDSVSMKGRIRFETFERMADKCVIIGDTFGTGHIMLEYIKKRLDNARADYYISYDPVMSRKINGIFERGQKIAFVIPDSRSRLSFEENRVNYINMKRFIASEVSDVRGELKYSFSLYKSCIDLALKYLEGARECHFALEEIYKEAMDFDIVNQKIISFCQKVL